MKAVIEVAGRGSAVRKARAQLANARKGQVPDFHRSFETARSLFSELTPARVELLETPRNIGPCSVYALAKSAERNYSNVHADVGRLEHLGLIERTEADGVFVPYEAVEIRLLLAHSALSDAQQCAAPGT
ncbi:MAG: hypothetical protein R3E87_02660 [Burkholderiaceae bacterium]